MTNMEIGIVDGRLAARSAFTSRAVLKDIPGASWDGSNRCWTYPLAWPSALALGVAAERLRESVIPRPEAMEWVADEGAVWTALTQEATAVACGQDEVVEGFFDHQVQCAKWLAMDGAHGGRLDISATGSGKSASALRAAWLCWSRGERGILLISTLVAVKYGWRSEVERVRGLLPLPQGAQWQVFTLESGATPVKRRKVIAEAAEASEAAGGVGVVLLTNHEQLRTHSRLSGYGDIALRRCPACGGVRDGDGVVSEAKCQAHDKELNKLPYVAVVWDEIHRMLDPHAQTTRAAWAIGDKAPRVWGLTGTPGSRSMMENTWSLLRAVYGADWPNKSSWTRYFAHCGPSTMGIWEIGRLRTEREPEFRAEYGALARRVLKSQVLDLPPLLRGGTLERYVGMSGEQLAAYESMRDDLWLKVQEGEVTAANILVQIGRLTMLANATGIPGPDYGKLIRVDHDEYGNDVPVYNSQMKLRAPSNKIDTLVDMALSGDFDGSSVVFQFVHPDLIGMLRDRFVEKKIINRAEEFGVIAGGVSEAQRSLAIDRFQHGKIKFIAFTAAAGGAGITLTAANTMVAVERPWSSIQWKQAQDRVHRIGSEVHDSVSILDIITDDSVEISQLERFRENEDSFEEVVRDMSRMKSLLFR